MKKARILVFLLIMVLTIGVFSGCGGGGTSDTGNNTTPSVSSSPAPTGNSTAGDKLKNPNITVVYWMTMANYENQLDADPNVYDPILDAVKPFEEKYGGKVTIKGVNWNDMLATMTQMQNAGTAPDLVEIYDRTFHNVVLNNFVMPLDQYVTDKDYSYYKVGRDLFSWKSKTYAIPVKPYLYYIMFNKDMFDMAGLTHPDEYFRQGKWNYDTFEQVGKALTKRVNGELVQYAFTSWTETIDAMILSNGGSIVSVDNKTGTVKSGLNDPKTQTALTQLSRWVDNSNGFMNIADNDWYSFDNNICAMDRGKEYPVDLPFKTGMVPIPAGPNAPPKSIYVYPQAMAVPVGAANPEGAVAFMRMVHERQKEVGDKKEAARIGQENYDMIYANDVNFIYSYDKAIDGFDTIQASIVNYMSEGTPAATIAETMNPQIDAAITKTFGSK